MYWNDADLLIQYVDHDMHSNSSTFWSENLRVRKVEISVKNITASLTIYKRDNVALR